MTDDLFHIRVNEVSKKYIRKLYPLGLASFVLGNILAVLFILSSIYQLSARSYSFDGSLKEIFYSIYPIYTIAYSSLGVIGNYFYFTFLKKMKQSILNADESSFNLSFKYVYINAVIFVTSTAIGLIFMICEMWIAMS